MKKIILLAFIIIIAIHIAGNFFGWYEAVPWLDIPMHIAGGAWVGLLFFYVFGVRKKIFNSGNNFYFLICGLGFAALIGVLWEFYEFAMDILIWKSYTPWATPGHIHFDTLIDLFNDLIGAFVAIVLLLIFSRKNSKNT
ncbi:MAG: hypothetical protein Q7R94_00455 [bacterium]|nr:hypothetical protein [bacterium]